MNRFMVRYLAWIANTVLFALCCFLIADTANAIIAALLNPSPATSVVAGQPSGLQGLSSNDHQQITDRNLFHSEVLSPPAEATTTAAAAANEELKETNLPLKLWGTIAANDPALSWASVEDTGSAVTSAVRVGDNIQSASIVAIERRRVVLLENGARRSLSLDGEEAPDSALQVSRRSTPPTRAPGARPPRRSSARSSDPAAQAVAPPMGNPNSLYSQARVKPQIDLETNQITGLELSNIQAGSVFEAVGIQNGEVITEVDGVPVSQMGPSTKIMSALSDPEQVEIVTVDPSGNSHHRVIVPPR
jgi:general secretion pathway protein C